MYSRKHFLIIAYRKQKTIGDHLIRAVLHPKPRLGARTRKQKPGFSKCGKCLTCHYVTPSSTHMSSATGEFFPITSNITCKTENIIYDLWCDKCRHSATPNPGSDHYVGKSSGDGASRFCRHKSDVNTGKDKAVPNHFNLPGHSSSDMRFLPFEALKRGGDATLLASREQYWIDKKKTFVFGINRQK